MLCELKLVDNNVVARICLQKAPAQKEDTSIDETSFEEVDEISLEEVDEVSLEEETSTEEIELSSPEEMEETSTEEIELSSPEEMEESSWEEMEETSPKAFGETSWEEGSSAEKDNLWAKLRAILDKAYEKRASQVIFQPDKKPRLRMNAQLETEEEVWPLEDFLVIDNQLRQATHNEPPMDHWHVQCFGDTHNPTLLFNLRVPLSLPLPEEVFHWAQKPGLLLLGASKMSISIAMLESLCHRLAHENNFCVLLVESGWLKPLHNALSTIVSVPPHPLPSFASLEESNFDVVAFEDLDESSQMHLAVKLASQKRLVIGAIAAQSSEEMLQGLPLQLPALQHLFRQQLIGGCFQHENGEAELFQPSQEWYTPSNSAPAYAHPNSAEATAPFALPMPEIQEPNPPKALSSHNLKNEASMLAIEELVHIVS